MLKVDADGAVVAHIVSGQEGRRTLIADVGALDSAAAALRSGGQPSADAASDANEPKLCPEPTPEPKTTKSPNSIAYREYISGLPYGLAISVGGVILDGCDSEPGILLEAKAKIDFMFDGNGNSYNWVNPGNDPGIQIKNQAFAAAPAGRSVVWQAQTETGYLALSKIGNGLELSNLSVVYDPH